MEENKNGRDEIYSEKVKAGKRTYFFDVKSTRSNDYYLTITESKKRYNQNDDGFTYEKHKIFLYKEDFGKFFRALHEVVEHIRERLPEEEFRGLPQIITFPEEPEMSHDDFRFDDEVFSDSFIQDDDR